MKTIRRAFERFFFTPTDGRPLAALRIVIGCAMLVEALSIFPYLNELYGRYGYLQADLIETLTGAAIPGLLAKAGLNDSAFTIVLKVFYFTHIALVISFLFGFKTRAANIGICITQALLINSGYLSSYGVDRYFHNLVFIMIWFPVARIWSVDSVRTNETAALDANCTFGLRLVQMFMLLTYANAGFSKSAGSDWWNGEAIWRVLNQPEFHRFDFLWLAHRPWISLLLGWGTMFIESFYILGVWLPYVGVFWILAMIGMHLGIATSMGLSLFGITLAAINGAVFLLPRVRADQPKSSSASSAVSQLAQLGNAPLTIFP